MYYYSFSKKKNARNAKINNILKSLYLLTLYVRGLTRLNSWLENTLTIVSVIIWIYI